VTEIHGRDGAWRPSPPPSVGTEIFTDEFVEELRRAGDDPADAAVTTFFEATDAGHAELFTKLAMSSAGAVADEDLPGIGPFVNELEPWPDWAEPELVREGQRVFGDWGPQLGMGLFMASIPADYAFAKGVQALGLTTRLTRNPKRRFVETGQMIIDAMTPGALEAGGRGYRAVRHVRLLHASVRHVLQHPAQIEELGAEAVAPWDESLGLPISQLELLGTLFSFNVMGIEALQRTGVTLSQREAEAYVHVWNLVGHQIGIRNDLLPLSLADSQSLWDVRRKKEYGPTDVGKELTAAAISCMQELFSFTHLPGLPASGIRHYLGDDTADILGVPPADWTRSFFSFLARTDRSLGRTLAQTPAVRSMTAALGRRMWKAFEAYGRQGERPSFEVTDELRQAWGLGS